jgi:hypothetical protein
MLLRKLADAIRAQNWFPVVLEIAIVVIGLLIGLQINEWADQRATERLYRTALQALVEESTTNRQLIDHTIEKMQSRVPTLESAVQSLVRCEPKPSIERTLNEAIEMSYSSVGPEQAFVAYQAVASNSRFQETMSVDFRRALNRYYSQIIAPYEWLRRNAELIDPAILFEGSLSASIQETNDLSSTLNRFRMRLAAPLPAACNERSFVRDMWTLHAIHAVNLGIARRMQERRSRFDDVLRAEIARIESRFGKRPVAAPPAGEPDAN